MPWCAAHRAAWPYAVLLRLDGPIHLPHTATQPAATQRAGADCISALLCFAYRTQWSQLRGGFATVPAPPLLAFSSTQVTILTSAARPLFPHERGLFLHKVSRQLCGRSPTDADVCKVAAVVLKEFRSNHEHE
jgi:hypothetical protein